MRKSWLSCPCSAGVMRFELTVCEAEVCSHGFVFFYFCVNLCFLFSKCIDQTKIRGGIKKQNKTKLGSPTWRGKPGGDCPEVWGNQELHRLRWGSMSESSVRSVHYSSTKWQMDDNVEEAVADAAVWDSKEHTRRRLHSKTEASVCFYFFFYLKKIKKMKPAAAEEDLGLWSFVSGCPPLWILPGSQISLACCWALTLSYVKHHRHAAV